MNRRDTIIVAVLMNMTLLAILFTTATRPEEQPQPASTMVKQESTPVEVVKTAPLLGVVEIDNKKRQAIDEIDEVLQEYALKQKSQPKVEVKAAAEKRLSQEEQEAQKEAQEQAEEAESCENVLPPVVIAKPSIATPGELAATESQGQVVVKKGDVLSKIAKQHGVTSEEIIRYNKLKNDKLHIGQKLLLPKKSSAKGEVRGVAKVSEIAASGQNCEYYVIRSGDNPWKIARRFHLEYEDLLKLNNLDEEKAKNLKIGQKIRIR